MPDKREPRYGDYRRHEDESKRLDRNFNELLQELRVSQAGVQILFGFLLSLAFQSRFETLDTFQLDVYLVALIASALAVTFFTGPVVAHRLLFRRRLKDYIVQYGARLAGTGLVFLATAVICGLVLVIDVLLTRTASISIGAGMLVVGLVIWVVLPLLQRRRGINPDMPDD